MLNDSFPKPYVVFSTLLIVVVLLFSFRSAHRTLLSSWSSAHHTLLSSWSSAHTFVFFVFFFRCAHHRTHFRLRSFLLMTRTPLHTLSFSSEACTAVHFRHRRYLLMMHTPLHTLSSSYDAHAVAHTFVFFFSILCAPVVRYHVLR